MSLYPNALDDDSSLYIAKDNIQTKITAAMGVSDTAAVVANPAGWVAYMVATVELEQMLVTNVSGNIITVTRAFNGTTAVAHGQNKTFSNFVDAIYQSSAKSALIAIETALGTNLSNITQTNDPIQVSRYVFSPQTPGGSLIVGTNVITMTPVPTGVNGSDVNHYLYISGGTGTAEAALITGGSGQAGDASGQIIVTCANTHSGAWTIQTATSGGQEAYVASADGSTLLFGPGTFQFYEAMYIAKYAVTVCGSGSNLATNLRQNKVTASLIVNTIAASSGATVRNLCVTYASAATAGSVALLFQGTAGGDVFSPTVDNVQIYSVENGIKFIDAQFFRVMNCMIQSYNDSGVISTKLFGSTDGGDSRIQNNSFLGSPSSGINGISLTHTPITLITGNKFNGGDYGLYIVHSSGTTISENSFENHNTTAVFIQANGGTPDTTVIDTKIENNTIDQNLDVAWNGVVLAPYGADAIKGVTISGNHFAGLEARTTLQIGVLFGGSSYATSVSIDDNDFIKLTNAVVVNAGSTNVSVINYTLGTGPDAVTTPFNLANTETTLKPSAPATYAQIVAMGTARDGSQAYCSDGQVTSVGDNTLTGGGSGCLTVRTNGVWRALAAQGGDSLPLYASVYAFSKAPGGSLIIGSNTITLTPVPLGINGADTGHWVYISGGVGTAEAVLITGGTATSGAATGTLIFTCANTHSGGWTISSATGGIAEAHSLLVPVLGGSIFITSAITMYAPVTGIVNVNTMFMGTGNSGPGKILRATTYSTGDLFTNSSGSTWTFKDLFFATSISTSQTGAAIHVSAGALYATGNTIYDGQYGIWCETCTGILEGNTYVQLDYSFQPAAAFRFGPGASSISATDMYCSGTNLNSANEMNAGVFIGGADTLRISGTFTVAMHGVEIDNTDAANANVNVTIFDSVIIDNRNNGILAVGSANTCTKLSVTGCVIEGDSDGTTGTQGQGIGINLGNGSASSVDLAVFANNTVTGFRQTGVLISSAGCDSLVFDGNNVFDNNRGAVAGQSGFQVDTGSTGLMFTGNSSKNVGGGIGAQKYGIYFVGAATATVTGNDLYPNTTDPLGLGGDFIGLLSNNKGVDDVTGTVASGASVALPWNPTITVTGTTGVGTVTGIWNGRTGTIITTDGVVVFTAGATIGNTKTTTQNVPVSFTVTGGKIYFS